MTLDANRKQDREDMYRCAAIAAIAGCAWVAELSDRTGVPLGQVVRKYVDDIIKENMT